MCMKACHLHRATVFCYWVETLAIIHIPDLFKTTTQTVKVKERDGSTLKWPNQIEIMGY